MTRKKYLEPLLALLFCSSASAQLKVHVRFVPISGFLVQLDCLSGVDERCATRNYKALWDKYLLKTEAQRTGLAQWKELRLKVNSVIRNHDFDLNDKIQIAALQAQDLEDYFTRLDLLMSPRDRDGLERLVRLYYAPFEQWWKQEAAVKGKQFATDMDKLLTSAAIKTRLQQFSRFYQSELPPNYVLSFSLLYRPNEIKEHSTGQQIQNYSRAEFLTKENPKDRIDVVIHELCHFFYGAVDPIKLQELKKRFLDLDRPTAAPGFNLLNETLAASFGNGMINRDLMPAKTWSTFLARDISFYNDTYIDRAAKALLPWLDKYLAAGHTLYDAGFPLAYLEALEKALGPDLLAPVLYFRDMTMVTDFTPAEVVTRGLRKYLLPSAITASGSNLADDKTYKTYLDNPRTSAMVVVHREGLGQLSKRGILNSAQLKQLKSEAPPVLLSIKRSPVSYDVVLVAETPEQMAQALEKFAAQKVMAPGLVRAESPR